MPELSNSANGESTLLSLIREGNSDAFSDLAKQYEPLLASASALFASENFPYGEAHEDALVALHAAAQTYRDDRGTTFGLFAKICIYRALGRAVDKCDDANAEPTEEEFSEDEKIEKKLLSDETLADFYKRVARLASALEYRVFRLYLWGYSAAETAKALGTSYRSVENARERLFKKIRENREMFADLY